MAGIAAGVALAVAGLRATLDPVGPTAVAPAADRVSVDPEAQAFARAYVREYLTWEAALPDDYERRTAHFASDELGPDSGAQLPRRGEQAVQDLSISRAQTQGSRTQVVVDASTTTGHIALSVVVARRGTRLAVIAPPALVASIPVDKAQRLGHEDPVDDGSLEGIATRAVSNFIAGQHDNLLADLDATATVVVPDRRLTVKRTEDATWVQPGRRIAVQAEVLDHRSGAVMALRYELAVVRRAGRWLVSAVQPLDPPMEESP